VTDQPIDQFVRVVDNGVRSFIPPTFCFDLVDESGALVATVSRISWNARNLSDFDAVTALQSESLGVTGIISEYDAGPQARKSGQGFTILSTAAFRSV
jgi:hypothetical protein